MSDWPIEDQDDPQGTSGTQKMESVQQGLAALQKAHENPIPLPDGMDWDRRGV